MDYLKRLNKFFVGSSYDFNSETFRGNFSIKKVKETKKSFTFYNENSLTDTVIDITVDLNHCEWYCMSGYWHKPTKGFRRHKIKANQCLRIIIKNEVKSMLTMLGVPYQIDDVKINWLHKTTN